MWFVTLPMVCQGGVVMGVPRGCGKGCGGM